jgi:hypothetical protein
VACTAATATTTGIAAIATCTSGSYAGASTTTAIATNKIGC